MTDCHLPPLFVLPSGISQCIRGLKYSVQSLAGQTTLVAFNSSITILYILLIIALQSSLLDAIIPMMTFCRVTLAKYGSDDKKHS